jgi:sec-independent protein translocase protein TatA
MGVHWTDLIIVAFTALLIFGPKRLPEIGSAMGRTYREFRKSLGEISELTTNDPRGSDPAPPSAALTRDTETADANRTTASPRA